MVDQTRPVLPAQCAGQGDEFEGASLDLAFVPFFNSLIGVCTVAILLLLTGVIELARHLLSRRPRPSIGT
jgi:hypothetical protein